MVIGRRVFEQLAIGRKVQLGLKIAFCHTTFFSVFSDQNTLESVLEKLGKQIFWSLANSEFFLVWNMLRTCFGDLPKESLKFIEKSTRRKLLKILTEKQWKLFPEKSNLVQVVAKLFFLKALLKPGKFLIFARIFLISGE